MIRRLITYLYVGNYDPCTEGALTAFNDIKQHEPTTPPASAYHVRYHKGGLFGSADFCACLMPNPKLIKQPVSELKLENKPADYKAVEKLANGLEVLNPLTIHATMYALADKYQVDGLGKLAKDKFEACLHHHSNSEDFVAAVQIAYGSTPETNRGLRDAVVKAFSMYFKVNISEIPGAEAKLETIDELSFLLIKSWPLKTKPQKMDTQGSGTTSTPAPSLFGNVPRTGGNLPSLFVDTSRPAGNTGGLFGSSPRPTDG